MLNAVIDTVDGFWTYQTPVSFLAGVGVYHLYCKTLHKGADERDENVQEER